MAVDEVGCCAVVTYVSNPLSSCARSAANDAANDGQKRFSGEQGAVSQISLPYFNSCRQPSCS